MAVSFRAMSPASPSFPGNGTICITSTEGAIEAGMSGFSAGSDAFITPRRNWGSGGSCAEASMLRTASVRAAVMIVRGLRS